MIGEGFGPPLFDVKRILLLFLSLVCSFSWATSYHVDDSGDNSDGLTKAKAFTSMAGADAVVSAGDDVTIWPRASGMYDAPVPTNNGTQGSPIEYVCDTSEAGEYSVDIDFWDPVNHFTAIRSCNHAGAYLVRCWEENGAGDIVIDDFRFKDAHDSGSQSMQNINATITCDNVVFRGDGTTDSGAFWGGMTDGETRDSVDFANRSGDYSTHVLFDNVNMLWEDHSRIRVDGDGDYSGSGACPGQVIILGGSMEGTNHGIIHRECATQTYVNGMEFFEISRGEGHWNCTTDHHTSCTYGNPGGSGASSDALRIWSHNFTAVNIVVNDAGDIEVDQGKGALSIVASLGGNILRQIDNIRLGHMTITGNYAPMRIVLANNGSDPVFQDVIIANSIFTNNIKDGDLGGTNDWGTSTDMQIYLNWQGSYTPDGASSIKGSLVGSSASNDVFRDDGGTEYTMAEGKLDANLEKDYFDVESSNVSGDPLFVDAGGRDFNLEAGSAAIDIGVALTTCTESTASVTQCTANDPYWFHDGWNMYDADWNTLDGSSVFIETSTGWSNKTLTSVNYTTGVIQWTGAITIASTPEIHIHDPSGDDLVDAGAFMDAGASSGPGPGRNMEPHL